MWQNLDIFLPAPASDKGWNLLFLYHEEHQEGEDSGRTGRPRAQSWGGLAYRSVTGICWWTPGPGKGRFRRLLPAVPACSVGTSPSSGTRSRRAWPPVGPTPVLLWDSGQDKFGPRKVFHSKVWLWIIFFSKDTFTGWWHWLTPQNISGVQPQTIKTNPVQSSRSWDWFHSQNDSSQLSCSDRQHTSSHRNPSEVKRKNPYIWTDQPFPSTCLF